MSVIILCVLSAQFLGPSQAAGPDEAALALSVKFDGNQASGYIRMANPAQPVILTVHEQPNSLGFSPSPPSGDPKGGAPIIEANPPVAGPDNIQWMDQGNKWLAGIGFRWRGRVNGRDEWLPRLAQILGIADPYRVELKALGRFYNLSEKITLDDGRQRISVVAKSFTDLLAYKWRLQKIVLPTVPMSTNPLQRFLKEVEMNEAFRSAGLNTSEIVFTNTDPRVIVARFIKGEAMDKIVMRAAYGERAALAIVRHLGEDIAVAHKNDLTVGDLKPDNILVSEGKNFFIDLDQGAKAGDKAWDIAEFLYYPLLFRESLFEWGRTNWAPVAREFLSGYIEAGGNSQNIRESLHARYLGAFFLAVPTANWRVIQSVRQEMKKASV